MSLSTTFSLEKLFRTNIVLSTTCLCCAYFFIGDIVDVVVAEKSGKGVAEFSKQRNGRKQVIEKCDSCEHIQLD